MEPILRLLDSPTGDERPDTLERVSSVVLNIIICIMIALLLVYAAFEPVHIVGSSMEPNVHSGDTVLIGKLFVSPERGDIVVFDNNGTRLIKRIIAVGGDRVGFCLDEEKKTILLYLDAGNGWERADETYINEPMSEETLHYANTDGRIFKDLECARSLEDMKANGKYVTVPEGKFVALGDNRNVSMDSRFYGTFPLSAIVGEYICTPEKGSFLSWALSVLFSDRSESGRVGEE